CTRTPPYCSAIGCYPTYFDSW
nr:immunoglobulin heavy chain junction region [Macaca mulatta]MOV42617.1 immunoglobulin heavy chain junction region [Macaca mulatta]MOV43998.1 immunoglobulin heavy chain junction region [Macaca mulatta]